MILDTFELINERILKDEIVGISKHLSMRPERLRKITKDKAKYPVPLKCRPVCNATVLY
jgi:hypothetical protein